MVVISLFYFTGDRFRTLVQVEYFLYLSGDHESPARYSNEHGSFSMIKLRNRPAQCRYTVLCNIHVRTK